MKRFVPTRSPQKKRGVPVFRTGERLSAKTVNDTIAKVRQGRARDIVGPLASRRKTL